jgi:hypothetical protein
VSKYPINALVAIFYCLIICDKYYKEYLDLKESINVSPTPNSTIIAVSGMPGRDGAVKI